MMACVRTLTFSLAVPGPLIAHDASQARTESWPCQPHRVLRVTHSLLGASPTVWTPAYQGRLKPLRSGGQPEPARSLCPFEGWNAGPQFCPQVPGHGLSIVSSLVPAFFPIIDPLQRPLHDSWLPRCLHSNQRVSELRRS